MDYGYDDGYYNATRNQYPPHTQQLTFSPDEPKYEKDNGQKSRKTSRLVLLILLIILLAATTALAAVSIYFEPWWTQEIGATKYEWIRVGLWKTCNKASVDADWICHDYDEDITDTPYGDMELLRICMLAGVSAAGLGFILTFIALCCRNTRSFKGIVIVVLILCLAAAVLFGVCIGYASDVDKASELVPAWILRAGGELDFGLYFYLTCGAGGGAFVSLVVASVFLFISDDDAYDETPPAEQVDGYDVDYVNKGYEANSFDIEREISRRGHNMVNHHPQAYDYPYDVDRHFPVYPIDKHRQQPQQNHGYGPQSNHPPPYNQAPVKSQPPKKPKRQSTKKGGSYDQRLEEEYHGGKPYQSYQPAVIHNQPMPVSRMPSQRRHSHSSYATSQYNDYSQANGNHPYHQPPHQPYQQQPPQQAYHQQQQQQQQQQPQQPRLVKVHQQPNQHGSLKYKKSTSKKHKRRGSFNSEPAVGYGEYEMYFNSPY